MNYYQMMILGPSIILLSTGFHIFANGWLTPVKGIYLLANFVGLTVVVTTALLESEVLEEVEK